MAKNLNIGVLLDFYGSLLSEKQRQFIDYYYNEDYSLAEIADLVGLTRQGVRDSIKKGEHILIETEEKLSFEKRFLKVSKYVESIEQAVVKMELLNKELKNSELGTQLALLKAAGEHISKTGPEVL